MEQEQPDSFGAPIDDNIPTFLIEESEVRQYFDKNFPKLLYFYDSIAHLYSKAHQEENVNVQQFTQKLKQTLNSLKIDPKLGQKVECQRQEKQGFFRCFDCAIKQNTITCKECFEYDRHIGHQFILWQSANGFCDCGNSLYTAPETFCRKHANVQLAQIDPKELEKSSKIFVAILSLGFYFCDKKIKVETKSGLLSEILSFLTTLISNSNFYLKMTAKLLLSSMDKVFKKGEKTILEILIENAWPENVEKLIKELIFQMVNQSEVISILMVKILEEIATHNPAMKNKWILLSSIIYALVIKVENLELLSKQNAVRFLVFEKNSFNPEQINFITRLFRYIRKEYSKQFIKIFKLMTEQIPIDKWIFTNICNKEDQNSQIRQNLEHFTALTQMFKVMVSDEENFSNLWTNLIKQTFQLILQQKSSFLIRKVFTLSFLAYFQFDFTAIFKSEKQFLMKLVLDHEQENIGEQFVKFIEENFSKMGELTQNFRSLCLVEKSLELIEWKIFCFLNEKLFSGNSIQSYIENKKLLNQVNLGQKEFYELINTVQNYIYIDEAKITDEVIQMQFLKSQNQTFLHSLYEELAYIYQKKNKKEFKQLALQWVEKIPTFKEFMLSSYQAIKQNQYTPKIINNLSFNSFLCRKEETTEKLTRFKAKLNKKEYFSEKILPSIDETTCIKLISIIQRVILVSSEENSTINKTEFARIMNRSIQMLMTVYLEAHHQQIVIFFDYLSKNKDIVSIFSDFNKQCIKMIFENIQLQTENEHIKNLQNSKQNDIARKKQQIRLKIKNSQQKAIEKIGVEYLKNEQQNSSDLTCILCQKTQPKSTLHYLCYARISEVLTNNLSKESKDFILFTTCGHLAHQTCLSESFSKTKQFGSSYNCFLCKNISNMRLPYILQGFDEKRVKEFKNELQTILILQFENFEQKLKNLSKLNSSLNISEDYLKQFKLTEQNFEEQIFRSITNQIYLFYLTSSLIFERRMLQIVPHLLEIYKVLTYQNKSSKMQVECEQFVDPFFSKIQQNIRQFTSNNHNYVAHLEHKYLNQSEGSMTVQTGNDLIQSIDKLFLKLSGSKFVNLDKIKQLERFGFYEPPLDLRDLKKMAGLCQFCTKLTDNILICFICRKKVCMSCKIKWFEHCLEHGGRAVSVSIRYGYVLFDRDNRRSYKQLYHNYIGENYRALVKDVKQGQFDLNMKEYELALERLVLQ